MRLEILSTSYLRERPKVSAFLFDPRDISICACRIVAVRVTCRILYLHPHAAGFQCIVGLYPYKEAIFPLTLFALTPEDHCLRGK